MPYNLKSSALASRRAARSSITAQPLSSRAKASTVISPESIELVRRDRVLRSKTGVDAVLTLKWSRTKAS